MFKDSSVEEVAFKPNTYRVVVCGDVLEHVPDRERGLEQLLEAATDDATFIISLPNVAHITVRLMPLAGLFSQMERGILDRTHLHFDPWDTAQQMLERVGLSIVWARPTGIPVDEVFSGCDEKSLLVCTAARSQHVLLKTAPRLFGFQWVFVAKRTHN